VLIISFLIISTASFSQKKNTKVDSAVLKKELDAVLSKYGLKTKGFAINVISINQKGGQTAYSITNNFYRDSSYIPDSVNYNFKISTYKEQHFLVVWPKYEVWHQPFVLYDSTKGNKSQWSGMQQILSGIKLMYNGKIFTMSGKKLFEPISKNSPLFINIDSDPTGVFAFGDFSNEKKAYIFFKGEITWLPLNIF
jgi:hypothetical protein